MIKILEVINWFRRGGVETQLLQILRDYDHSRFHIDVCCFGTEPGYLTSQARDLGAEVLFCPKSINLLSFSKRFREIAGRHRYDIIHCHSEAWSGPILRGARDVGVPVRIAHIRSVLPQGFRIRNPIIKGGRNLIVIWGHYWLLKHATHVLGVSRAALDARVPGWEMKKGFSIWTLGVDTEKFSPIQEKWYIKSRNPVLINVSSFIQKRRQDLLLHIFALVLDQLPGTRLVLVGEGECLRGCKALAQRLGVSAQVEFLGLREDIPNLLRKADIFVSCTEAEGLPNVLLEAQAVGLPVVASDIPSHREALPKTAHPFLYQHHNLQTAADNIVRTVKNPHLYGTLSRDGRGYVVKYYDAKSSLERLEGMYLKFLKGKE